MTSPLDEYRSQAAQHGSHTIAGDADAINKSYDCLHRTLALLRGPAGETNCSCCTTTPIQRSNAGPPRTL